MQASEVVLQSVQGFAADQVIDYSAKEPGEGAKSDMTHKNESGESS